MAGGASVSDERVQRARSWRVLRPARTSAVVVAAAIALSAVVGAAASVDAPATVERPAVRVDPPSPFLLVSDSAWLGIKTYGAVDAVQGVEHMLDLASCRRRVSPSCRNYDGHVPITLYEELAWRRRSFHTLVVATGYNDSDRNFRSDLDAIVERARGFGYQRVLWVTLRSNVSYTSPGDAGFAAAFERNNAALQEIVASGVHPELVIADWATYARDQPQWFARDGIHLQRDGPWAAADYISRKLAFLDGRACPQPLTPGGPVADPCPDPDAAPPQVDLAGLYPIGRPNPTAGFFMEWEGHGAWPAPPWWR